MFVLTVTSLTLVGPSFRSSPLVGPHFARTAQRLDAACAAVDPDPQQAEAEAQTLALLNSYESLPLRGFASCAESLPAQDPGPSGFPRAVTPERQFALTGLPTSAFAPPDTRGSIAYPLAGAAAAAALMATASALGIESSALLWGGAALFAADLVALKGSGLEIAARALRPEYRRTIINHEAGHFLTAYLLGCPVQACLINPWRALRDGRFGGVAGTVFFDPALASGMQTGALKRSVIDRYSVVVMGGIAAEAMLNGRAEGGKSDETALIQLLSSLDGGRSWDLAAIQNQARWSASNALLLLREHRAAFDALVAAVDRGCSVGEAVAAIEAALGDDELPAERRGRLALAA